MKIYIATSANILDAEYFNGYDGDPNGYDGDPIEVLANRPVKVSRHLTYRWIERLTEETMEDLSLSDDRDYSWTEPAKGLVGEYKLWLNGDELKAMFVISEQEV